jgi:hypothetical protein
MTMLRQLQTGTTRNLTTPKKGRVKDSGHPSEKPTTGFLARSLLQVFATKGDIGP